MMLFSSILFLFRFLPVTLFLYYLSPYKFKNLILLACSLVFYSWGEIKYLWIMAAVILLNYISSLLIENLENRGWRLFFLILSIIGSLSFLLYFKYAYFFASNMNRAFGLGFTEINTVVLPLGISFYTFHSMSYAVDVYRHDVPCERNIINYGAYIVMFPHLIAGPIVRYKDIRERLHMMKGRITAGRIDEGVTLFVFGLAKKVLIADGVNTLWTDIIGQYNGASLVAEGIGLPNASTPLAWLGVLAFTLYIYYDFSGYSMMGIGLAKMLGFDFPTNFNLPYTSRSITEFWRRWHITLSSWFRDYVYIPLGGNRKGINRQIVNLLIIWLLTGFWHGANWNFILWGLYYALFLILEKLFLLKWLQKSRVLPHLYTLAVVTVGWALFVSSDPGVGLLPLFRKLFIPEGGVSALYFLRNYIVILIIGILFSSSLPQRLYEKVKHITVLRAAIVMSLFFVCISYMVAGGYKPFLYFNF